MEKEVMKELKLFQLNRNFVHDFVYQRTIF
jgi:hypothetical protein